MTTHARVPDGRGERAFAVGHHAAANPVAQFVVGHTEWAAFASVFLLTVCSVQPRLAAFLALGLAAVMLVAAGVASLRGAAGNCDEIIASVRRRQSGEDGE